MTESAQPVRRVAVYCGSADGNDPAYLTEARALGAALAAAGLGLVYGGANAGLTRLEFVSTMHQRKARMAELADAFLILPGGYGTLEELLEVVTWAQLRLHAKPVILINTGGYWDGFLQFLDTAVAAGFLRPKNRALLLVAANAREAVEMLVNG